MGQSISTPTESTPADTLSQTISITTDSINIPEYHKGVVPVARKEMYKMLGVKFVKIETPTGIYFVYDKSLEDVVERLGLYAWAG